MRAYHYICLTTLATLISLTSSGQTVINTSKESGVVSKPVKLKDTTVYKIITQTKDTFYFGSDKKVKIMESATIIYNTLKANNQSFDIQFNADGKHLMTLSLRITKQHNDTIAVYSIFDPTLIVRLHIEKIYNCDIRAIQINNYDKVSQYAYHRRILTKLLDFKNQ